MGGRSTQRNAVRGHPAKLAAAPAAIGRIAEATCTSVQVVGRLAEALARYNPGLWPRATTDGGDGSRIDPGHLVSLVLALGLTAPVSKAADCVLRYGALLKHDPARAKEEGQPFPGRPASDPDGIWPLLSSNSLFMALARSIDQLAVSGRYPGRGVSLILSCTSLHGVIRYHEHDEISSQECYLAAEPLPLATVPVPPPTAIQRMVTLPAPLFDTLSRLWNPT